MDEEDRQVRGTDEEIMTTASVTDDGSELRPAPQGSRWFRRLAFLSAACLLVALWFSVGPWTVRVDGSSFGCGSPLMGRYRSVGDPMANASWACHLQAPHRLAASVAFFGAAVILALLAALAASLGARGRRALLQASVQDRSRLG